MLLLLIAACSDYGIEDARKDPGGPYPDIVVEPASVSFGTVEVGCGVDQDVRISNVGEATLDVSGMEWSGDGVITGTTTSFSLPAGESTVTTVHYWPTAAGHASADLVISSNDPDDPRLHVPHDGAAVTSATTDRYVQRTPEVDVLWVIDNSGSMAEEQARVIADIETFFDYFETLQLDYHMGVITTDIVTPTMQGRLQGSPAFITPDTPYPDAVLSSALAVGTEDQGDESGLAAMQLALTEPILSGENAGFIRPDAQLVIVFLSDEPEQSGVASSEYIAFLRDFKADPTFVNVSAIVGDYDAGCATTCDGADSTAQPGNAYVDVANAFPGVFASICTCSLGESLDRIGLDSTLFTRRFPLTATPANPTLIDVTVEGVPRTEGWSYDAGTNAVVFDTPPRAGELIDLTYDRLAECG